jgi:hypothetical protein
MGHLKEARGHLMMEARGHLMEARGHLMEVINQTEIFGNHLFY